MKQTECQTIFAMLSEYLDGQLPPATCEELETHIRDCPPCVAFVDSLKKTVRLGKQYSPPAEAPPISPEVRSALSEAFRRAHKK